MCTHQALCIVHVYRAFGNKLCVKYYLFNEPAIAILLIHTNGSHGYGIYYIASSSIHLLNLSSRMTLTAAAVVSSPAYGAGTVAWLDTHTIFAGRVTNSYRKSESNY